MAIFGTKGLLAAYCGTIIGLNIAFSVGRFLPMSFLNKGLRKFNLQHDSKNFDSSLERLAMGKGSLPLLGRVLLRNGYLALALSLNFPGNSFVGGGGGLSMLAGISRRLVYWPYFLVVSIIAPLPIPLLILLGILNADRIVEQSAGFHAFLDAIILF